MIGAPVRDRGRLAVLSLGFLALVAALALALLARAEVASADWTYERVTPVDKSGGGLMNNTYRAASDGSGLLYTVTGSMAGVPAVSSPMYTRYLATRGDAGWDNRAIDPPWDIGVPPGGALFTIQLTLGSSESLEWIVQTSNEALTPDATQDGSNLYALNTQTNERHLIATSPDRADFTHDPVEASGGATGVVKFVGNDGTVWFNVRADAPDLVPDAPGASTYRWHPTTGLEAVGRMPLAEGGDYATSGVLGHWQSTFGVPSPIVPWFSSGNVYFRDSSTGSNQFGNGVYMLGATGSDPMVPLSLDRSAAATGVRPALLHGASADGRYAVFQVVPQGVELTNDTPDLGGQARYVYRYDSQTDELLSVGATRWNSPNATNGVQEVGPDGKTILFLSEIVQAPGAVDGRSNLYVWREGEPLRLVRTSDVGSSGAANNGWLRLLSNNGHYFMFTDNSYGIAQQFGYDNRSVACSSTSSPAPCDVVYRYDVEEEELECVSCRPDGELPEGHAGAPKIRGSMAEMPMDARQVQYVADDGTVFFDTADPLVTEDVNGRVDTYAWRDGAYRLVSRATAGEPSRFIDATPDGRSVFFATSDAMVPSDVDRSQDIYVARLDGGFVEPGDGAPEPCRGSGCRAPSSGPAGLPPLGSVGFSGQGNVSAPADRVKASVGVRRRQATRGVVARVRVRVPAAGRVLVAGRRVRRSARVVSKAGTVSVRIVLRPRVRRALKQTRKVRAAVRVVYRSSDGGRASKRVRVTFKHPKLKKGGR